MSTDSLPLTRIGTNAVTRMRFELVVPHDRQREAFDRLLDLDRALRSHSNDTISAPSRSALREFTGNHDIVETQVDAIAAQTQQAGDVSSVDSGTVHSIANGARRLFFFFFVNKASEIFTMLPAHLAQH